MSSDALYFATVQGSIEGFQFFNEFGCNQSFVDFSTATAKFMGVEMWGKLGTIVIIIMIDWHNIILSQKIFLEKFEKTLDNHQNMWYNRIMERGWKTWECQIKKSFSNCWTQSRSSQSKSFPLSDGWRFWLMWFSAKCWTAVKPGRAKAFSALRLYYNMASHKCQCVIQRKLFLKWLKLWDFCSFCFTWFLPL